MIYIGIDVSKDKHDCLIKSNIPEVKTFPTTALGIIFTLALRKDTLRPIYYIDINSEERR